MTTVLYLGRFQPFHDGHKSVIKHLLAKYDRIVVAIGSAQYERILGNPFSYHERYTMITKVFDSNKRIRIIPLPDIDSPRNYVKYSKAVFGNYDLVFTNNPNTKALFEINGDEVVGTKELTHNKKRISGTRIRRLILEDGYFKSMIPWQVYDYLKEIDAYRIIVNTYLNYHGVDDIV